MIIMAKKYQIKRIFENKYIIIGETDVFIGIMQFFSSIESNQNLNMLSVWMNGVKLDWAII